MKPTTIASLSILLASANAAPRCGNSTFESSGVLAIVDDCQALLTATNHVNQPGLFIAPFGWELASRELRTLLAYKSCSFSARATTGKATTLGDQDAHDLIRESIAQKQKGGKVSVAGVLDCAGVSVQWMVGSG
jgi:hypothetical protein